MQCSFDNNFTLFPTYVYVHLRPLGKLWTRVMGGLFTNVMKFQESLTKKSLCQCCVIILLSCRTERERDRQANRDPYIHSYVHTHGRRYRGAGGA